MTNAQQQPAEPPSADEVLRHLHSATHALRSYQYGNGAPDLARRVADDCEALLKRANYRREPG